MTAVEATTVICETLSADTLALPMADGGEGTAEAIAALSSGWRELRPGCFYNSLTNTAAVDSSALVGYTEDILVFAPTERTSAPLGRYLNELYGTYKPTTIYVGIGGTAVCDGGEGFLRELSPDVPWRDILYGLADVAVPLLPGKDGEISALSFCPQKGYTSTDIATVTTKLHHLIDKYGEPHTPFAGAGGGLGYALGDVLGARCTFGAHWLLEHSDIPWDKITVAITGEGRYDAQTNRGKVVSAVAEQAARHGISTYCFAGCVSENVVTNDSLHLIDLSLWLSDNVLTPETARQRLRLAVRALLV